MPGNSGMDIPGILSSPILFFLSFLLQLLFPDQAFLKRNREHAGMDTDRSQCCARIRAGAHSAIQKAHLKEDTGTGRKELMGSCGKSSRIYTRGALSTFLLVNMSSG